MVNQCSICKTYPLCQNAGVCLNSKDQKILQQDDAEGWFREAVKNNRMLDAIKYYGTWKNVGLKVAADYVKGNWESLRGLARGVPEPHPPSSSQKGLSGLTNTLKEMEENPELAEVNDMMTDHLNSLRKPARKDWFNIRVSHVFPPIPDRRFDWCAYYEGEEEKGNYGEGSTPYMAILDLINNHNPTEYWESQK